jgi:hypothetical protein
MHSVAVLRVPYTSRLLFILFHNNTLRSVTLSKVVATVLSSSSLSKSIFVVLAFDISEVRGGERAWAKPRRGRHLPFSAFQMLLALA